MIKCFNTLLVLIMSCLLISSCKLDTGVSPDDGGSTATTNTANTNKVTGTTLSGTTVNNNNLSASWKVVTTTKQFYDQNNVVVASSLAYNLFTSAVLNEANKTITFDGITAAAPEETYSLSSINGVLYIQLSADPFLRSVNAQIQITNLTGNSMTWLAMDPLVVTAGGQLLRNAYQVTFTKAL